MTRYRSTYCHYLFVLLLPVFLLPAATSRAASWSLYDLDSLVHLSEEIVEVKVIGWHPPAHRHRMDVQVERIHKGSFEKGQVVTVTRISDYCKKKTGELNSRLLEPGDRLVLFLVLSGPNEILPMPKDNIPHRPLQGGVSLIDGNYLHSFTLTGDVGQPMATPPHDPDKSTCMTTERFREQIQQSFRKTRTWVPLLEAEQDELDVPRLLELLESRPTSTVGDLDYFAQRICTRLALTRDPEILDRALMLTRYYVAKSRLRIGFSTPVGRDYLLAKVADSAESSAARLRYADMLYAVGPEYFKIEKLSEEIGPYPGPPEDEPARNNAAYITRIAKVAVENHHEEEICGRLIRTISSFANRIMQSKREPMLADLSEAYLVLKDFYDTQPSQELQFAIENAPTYDHEFYQRLNSACGPYISIVRPAEPIEGKELDQGQLRFEYSARFITPNQIPFAHQKLVLVHQMSGQRHELPPRPGKSALISGSGTITIKLPEDLPAGRYKVFFQLKNGEKVISTGHHFFAEL